jgi:hypothetical protein
MKVGMWIQEPRKLEKGWGSGAVSRGQDIGQLGSTVGQRTEGSHRTGLGLSL